MKSAYIPLISLLLLVGMANALTINSPEAITYDSSSILINITHNQSLDSINYTLDSDQEVAACTNCSGFSKTINLTEGVHTLIVNGTLGNETLTAQVNFTINIPEEFSLTLNSPEARKYDTGIVNLNVASNEPLEKISYLIDNLSEIVACNNCSAYSTTLNLAEGMHELTVFGTLENITKNDSVKFEIDAIKEQFVIAIKSPEAKIYYDDEAIRIEIEANTTLDSLYAQLGSRNWTCNNCFKINETVNLSVGNYSLKVKGTLEDITKESFVNFRIVKRTNYTVNYTNMSRFDTGFQKLPQMVEAGNITDAELADIIRNNQLNPGVLNRLIKTGKLGNESINAILDTQFQPPGIFRKMLGFMGFKVTYPALIEDNYNLTVETKEKLAKRDDLPRRTKERINNEVDIAKKTPPGQAKKISSAEENSAASSGAKTPPGQAKKNN